MLALTKLSYSSILRNYPSFFPLVLFTFFFLTWIGNSPLSMLRLSLRFLLPYMNYDPFFLTRIPPSSLCSYPYLYISLHHILFCMFFIIFPLLLLCSTRNNIPHKSSIGLRPKIPHIFSMYKQKHHILVSPGKRNYANALKIT